MTLYPMLRNALLACAFSLAAATHLSAQSGTSDWPKHEFVVGGGVSQLLLGGANLQVDYYTGRWTFDYSHGFNLKLGNNAVSQDDQDQQLNIRMPWTTGFGIGYRFTRHFSVRFEPKVHRMEVYYNDTDYSNPIKSYTTYTLGIGAYYRWLPFEKSESWAKGLTVMPSLRFWPNVGSSLDGDEFRYQNRLTGKEEVHKAAKQGFGGVVANITIGYTFTKN